MGAAAAAELSATAEAIAGYQQRIAGLLESTRSEGNEDLLVAIHEAERSLSVAQRSVRRALKLASRR